MSTDELDRAGVLRLYTFGVGIMFGTVVTHAVHALLGVFLAVLAVQIGFGYALFQRSDRIGLNLFGGSDQ